MVDQTALAPEATACGTAVLESAGGRWDSPEIWMPYAAADAVLERMQELFEQPSSHRTPGMLLHGDTNNGKTTVAHRFARQKNREAPQTAHGPEVPVIYAQTPATPDLATLYGGILRFVQAPFPTGSRADRRLDQVLALLPQLQTRMLIIDEVHNVLSGTPAQRSQYLNALKFLSNELRIPLVLIGTQEARLVIQTDQQLGNRFHPMHLPRWQPDKHYAAYCINVFRYLGAPFGGLLKGKALVNTIHSKTGGLTGETWNYARHVVRAAEAVTGELTTAVFEAPGWVEPERRRG